MKRFLIILFLTILIGTANSQTIGKRYIDYSSEFTNGKQGIGTMTGVILSEKFDSAKVTSYLTKLFVKKTNEDTEQFIIMGVCSGIEILASKFIDRNNKRMTLLISAYQFTTDPSKKPEIRQKQIELTEKIIKDIWQYL